MNIDAGPIALGVGTWQRMGPEGVDYGVLVRLFLPEGLTVDFDDDRSPLVLPGEATLNLRLGPVAAAHLADELVKALAPDAAAR